MAQHAVAECVSWRLGLQQTVLCPLGSDESRWPKPQNPFILVICFTASACWDKKNRMAGLMKSKLGFFWSLFCFVIFWKGGLWKWLFLLHLQGLIYQLRWSSAAFLAHSDRHILCLMTKALALLSGYSGHACLTSNTSLSTFAVQHDRELQPRWELGKRYCPQCFFHQCLCFRWHSKG